VGLSSKRCTTGQCFVGCTSNQSRFVETLNKGTLLRRFHTPMNPLRDQLRYSNRDAGNTFAWATRCRSDTDDEHASRRVTTTIRTPRSKPCMKECPTSHRSTTPGTLSATPEDQAKRAVFGPVPAETRTPIAACISQIRFQWPV
jgi:hypothetical protein